MFWGPANVHAELKESEREINTQINDVYAPLIPQWDRPQTFRDWSNDWKLWDFHVGVGRDLGFKWSWFLDLGGIVGEVKNDNNYYPLGIPIKVKINFSRLLWFAATGVDYFPWGKPCLAKVQGHHGIVRSLLAARPYLEAAAGFVSVKEVADGKFSLRGTGLEIEQKQTTYHHVTYGSPRVGLEIPLGKKDSLALEAGYLFFTSHASDLNNLSLYVLHQHRF